VKGLSVDKKKEEDIRILIDDCIKKFSPSVFCDSYSITFIPVAGEDGKIKGT
jgi:hypothetical protein